MKNLTISIRALDCHGCSIDNETITCSGGKGVRTQIKCQVLIFSNSIGTGIIAQQRDGVVVLRITNRLRQRGVIVGSSPIGNRSDCVLLICCTVILLYLNHRLLSLLLALLRLRTQPDSTASSEKNLSPLTQIPVQKKIIKTNFIFLDNLYIIISNSCLPRFHLSSRQGSS